MSEENNTTATCCPTAQNEPSSTNVTPVHYQRPRYRVESHEAAHVLSIAMPGVNKEGVDVSLNGDELTITGNRTVRTPETWKTVFSELDDDHFRLKVRLNVNLDTKGITATVKDGVLTLTLPIREEAKPRAIAIS